MTERFFASLEVLEPVNFVQHQSKIGFSRGINLSIPLMPVIPVGAQIFDVVFHPTLSIVYTGLLDGCVKAFAYNDQGNHKPLFSLQPSKRSCRGLSLDQDGSHLFAVGKGKALR
jgi:hypothetical protein